MLTPAGYTALLLVAMETLPEGGFAAGKHVMQVVTQQPVIDHTWRDTTKSHLTEESLAHKDPSSSLLRQEEEVRSSCWRELVSSGLQPRSKVLHVWCVCVCVCSSPGATCGSGFIRVWSQPVVPLVQTGSSSRRTHRAGLDSPVEDTQMVPG